MLTSKMKAVIDPGRYGLTVIDKIFGVHRPRKDQNLLLSGELVKDKKTRAHSKVLIFLVKDSIC